MVEPRPALSAELLFRSIVQNPKDTATCDALVSRILDSGIRGVFSTQMSVEAAQLLDGSSIPEPLQYLARRLSFAGQQPGYPYYTGIHLFRDFCSGQPHDVCKDTAFLIRVLSSDLLDRFDRGQFVPPHRERFVSTVNELSRRCAELSQSPTPHRLFESNLVLKLCLLPESPVKGELVFLRVLQIQDATFAAARNIADEAERWIRHSEASCAANALDFLERLTTLLGAPLKILMAGLDVSDWRVLREYITYPSAIQSPDPGCLANTVKELKRLLSHRRWESRDGNTITICGDFLKRSSQFLDAWTKAHTAVALHFNGNRSPGTAWLIDKTSKGEALFQ